MNDADEGDVVDLVGDVGLPGDRRLELAGQVGQRVVADEALHDLLDGGGAVEDLVGGYPGDR